MPIHYYSTQRVAPPVGLERAIFHGLAPDGGLYFPDAIPRLDAATLATLRALAPPPAQAADPAATLPFLQAVGAQVLQAWFSEELGAATLRALSAEAQNFPIPLRAVGPFQVMELFHGPTLAFKDVAARHLARLMNHFLARRGERAILLVATSGDTGGAIAHGFAGQSAIQVVVLFPKGKVSRLQEAQLTRVAPNVTPVEVEGVFDDCQALVKQALVHPSVADLPLTSANSINIARLIPQVIYHLYAPLLLGRSDLELVVPSGNFGNLTAALFARAMGAPLPSLVAATNANDAAPRYYQSGEYEPRPTVPTLSTAMDVGQPSNFARVLELFGHAHERFRAGLRAFAVDDASTRATIRQVWEAHGYLLCPHSAVGWAVAARHATPGLCPVVVATASPAKFAQELRDAVGLTVDDGPALARLPDVPPRKRTIPAAWPALESILREVAG